MTRRPIRRNLALGDRPLVEIRCGECNSLAGQVEPVAHSRDRVTVRHFEVSALPNGRHLTSRHGHVVDVVQAAREVAGWRCASGKRCGAALGVDVGALKIEIELGRTKTRTIRA